MSLKVKISTKELKKDTKAFLKRKLKAVNMALDAVALDVQGDAKKNLDNNKTTDRGILKGSITKSNTGTAKRPARTVGTQSGYGAFVELGRSPGDMPPTSEIKGWVVRKLKIPLDKADAVAFFVARAIKERGTKAQPFLGPAFQKNKRNLPKALKRAYKIT